MWSGAWKAAGSPSKSRWNSGNGANAWPPSARSGWKASGRGSPPPHPPPASPATPPPPSSAAPPLPRWPAAHLPVQLLAPEGGRPVPPKAGRPVPEPAGPSPRKLARRAASPQGALPPALVQGGTDLVSGEAAALGDIRPSVPQGDLADCGIGVVPAHIGPAGPLRVGGAPIQFHHHMECLILDVLVLPPSPPHHRALSPPCGQSVRTFDVVHVTKLQQRVHPLLAQANRHRERTPPPNPGPP